MLDCWTRFCSQVNESGDRKLRDPTVSYFSLSFEHLGNNFHRLKLSSFFRNTLSWSKSRAHACFAWMEVFASLVLGLFSSFTLNPTIPATTAASSSANSLLQLGQNCNSWKHFLFMFFACLIVRGADVIPVGASEKVWLRKSVMNHPEKPTSGENPQTTNSS